MEYYVYHLIDPKTNLPFYVGKGKDNRMYHHEGLALNNRIPNNNKLLYHKIRKVVSQSNAITYLKIKENLSEQEAIQLEVDEIRKFGKKSNNSGILCNLTDGGEGVSGLKHSQKTRKTMSILSRQPHRIKIACKNAIAATQRNIGKRKLEKYHDKIVNLYKTHSLKTMCQILSCDFVTLKNYLIEKNIFIKNRKPIMSEKGRKNIALGNVGKRSVPILQMDITGIPIKRWNSISDACISLNKPNRQGDIWTCCNGGQKSAFGYKWSFL